MRKLLIVEMLMLLASTSHAANIYMQPGRVFAPDAINIRIVGEIQLNDDEKFANRVEKIPQGGAVVYLSSPGGDMVTGMKIGFKVYEKNSRRCYPDAHISARARAPTFCLLVHTSMSKRGSC
jgi:hypothetical protein